MLQQLTICKSQRLFAAAILKEVGPNFIQSSCWCTVVRRSFGRIAKFCNKWEIVDSFSCDAQLSLLIAKVRNKRKSVFTENFAGFLSCSSKSNSTSWWCRTSCWGRQHAEWRELLEASHAWWLIDIVFGKTFHLGLQAEGRFFSFLVRLAWMALNMHKAWAWTCRSRVSSSQPAHDTRLS